jgi:hypothetical protein
MQILTHSGNSAGELAAAIFFADRKFHCVTLSRRQDKHTVPLERISAAPKLFSRANKGHVMPA